MSSGANWRSAFHGLIQFGTRGARHGWDRRSVMLAISSPLACEPYRNSDGSVRTVLCNCQISSSVHCGCLDLIRTIHQHFAQASCSPVIMWFWTLRYRVPAKTRSAKQRSDSHLVLDSSAITPDRSHALCIALAILANLKGSSMTLPGLGRIEQFPAANAAYSAARVCP